MQLKHPENNHPMEKEKNIYMYVVTEDTNAHLRVTWLKKKNIKIYIIFKEFS